MTAAPITDQQIRSSAYRTLGLSASATQRDIDSAARKMRIWPDPARIPPTPWDIPSLGALARTKPDIERALTRLYDPQTRLMERLIWFSGPQPLTSAPPDSGAPSDPRALHDLMMLHLHRAVLLPLDSSDTQSWRYLLDHCQPHAAACSTWLAAAETAGQFEKQTTAAEIDSAAESLPAALAGALEERIVTAVTLSQWPTARQLAELLQNRRALPGVPEVCDHLLNRLEDLLDLRCRQEETDLRAVLRTNDQFPGAFYSANAEACHKTRRAYETDLLPQLRILMDLSAHDPDRYTRVRSKIADLLAVLAIGWEWSGDFPRAKKSLEVALSLARNTPRQPAIERELTRVSNLVLNPPIASPRIQLNIPKSTSTGGGVVSGRFGRTAVFIALLILIRVLAYAITSTNNTSSAPQPAPVYYPSPPVYPNPAAPGPNPYPHPIPAPAPYRPQPYNPPQHPGAPSPPSFGGGHR